MIIICATIFFKYILGVSIMHFGASQNSQYIWLLLKNQYDHYQEKSATQVRKLTFLTLFPHLSLT